MVKAQKKNDNTAQTHSFNAETSKILRLVIHSLYTNRDIFIRELVSNASDACEKLRYLSLTKPELMKDDSELSITLSADEKAKTLTVSDNGIGMSEQDLITNLGTIAKSGTEEFLGQLSGDTKKDASLIGQFGVGFYSVFMVADHVRVETRKAGEEQSYIWESTGDGSYTIEPAKSDLPRGTRITLTLKDGEEQYTDKFRISHIINTYSDHISFPIRFQGGEGDATEVLNEGSALWTRQKSAITKAQYEEFYHHVGHSSDEPWLTLQNQVEGKLSYTNLLFVPSVRPFDLFHPERRRRVKLYVKRVFITDENIDLVPHHLRFLRGIIDSDDLPLNISRETLQNNPQLANIRDSITKKVLSELKKKSEKDKESYAKFWANFGGVLKEGLCEHNATKEALLEACVFNTTAGPQLSSLDEYVARMSDKQEHIYYITGDRVDTLRTHPQIEGFLKKGIEVVLLHDHVDDFWVTVTPDYKGKKFKSVLSAGEELKNFGTDAKKDDVKDDNKPASSGKEIDNLIAAIKTILGDEVKDVRTTAKLTESPVCLAVEDGAMSMRMERFLVEHKQMKGTSARILEINPDHPVIVGLAKRVTAHGVSANDVEDTARLLFDQAKIVEGEELSDPAAFTRRLSALLSKGFMV